MTTINPYLQFNGNTEESFNFYKSIFGGEFKAMQSYGEMPSTSEKITNSGCFCRNVSFGR